MKTQITVVVCTHNPNPGIFKETIDALKSQTLPHEDWELIVVDNSSHDASPVNQLADLTWHPSASCVRESKLGKTIALLTAFQMARNNLIVIVDDDNILDPDYLNTAISIADSFPQLGVWGAGNIYPRFEVTPEEWTRQYWYLLALREQEHEIWSNFHSPQISVVGAGMCLRRSVMLKYVELVSSDTLRSSLDPIGQQLNRAGDQDIHFSAYDLRLGAGVFPSLKLTHIMPAFRLKEEYLLRLVDGYVYSNSLLNWIRNIEPITTTSLAKQLFQKIRPWFMPPRQRRFYQAAVTALARAKHDYSNILQQSKMVHP